MLETVDLFGFNFIRADGFDQILSEVRNYTHQSTSDQLPLLITPNVDQVVRMKDWPEISAIRKSAFTLPDGKPICWISRLKGHPLNRLSGADFFHHYMEQKAYLGLNVLFLVPNEPVFHFFMAKGVPVHLKLAPALTKKLSAENELAVSLIDEISSLGTLDHLIIGLGYPKQEQLALLLINHYSKKKMKPPLIMLLGASFDFYSGHRNRAPVWMQKIGLEWFHRMMTEPNRLIKRYAYSNSRFVLIALRELFAK